MFELSELSSHTLLQTSHVVSRMSGDKGIVSNSAWVNLDTRPVRIRL